jgi:putative two-component system response regulator
MMEEKPRILVADDQPDNLLIIEDLLSDRYEVHTVEDGQQVLDFIAGRTLPDLILLDVVMPRVDGHAVIRHLKADPRTRDIPVIFLTGKDSMADEQIGFNLGAVDYIAKPVRPPIMLARVQTHLDLKRVRDWLSDQNSALEAEIAQRMAENLLIQDVSVHALAHLAEKRDPETGNHLRRTKGYVRTLARHLQSHPRFAGQLDDRVIETLVKSAPLHDIGKVGIPDQILLKPGKLTEAEWAIMKTHAALGAEAIEEAEVDAEKPVAFLSLAKEIARWHHERWDGSGYPDGLAGDAIPLSARLMALADVFDAMISRRVYKGPMTFAEARDIILAERGSHFDPDIVDAFVTLFEEFCAIAQKYHDGGV